MTDSIATGLAYISMLGLIIAFGGILATMFKSKLNTYRIIGVGAIIFLLPMLLLMMFMVLDSVKATL